MRIKDNIKYMEENLPVLKYLNWSLKNKRCKGFLYLDIFKYFLNINLHIFFSDPVLPNRHRKPNSDIKGTNFLT